MIYLIETTYYNKTTQEIVDLLKIGYTGDSNKQTRYTQYRLHNPLFRILYEIPEATELEEKKLQYYFREYQYGDYGNEWFRYDDKILDYFKDHTTKESLIDLPDLPGDKRVELSKFRGEVRKAVEYVLNVKVDQGVIQLSDALKQVDSLTDRIIDRRIRTTESLWKYIKDVFDVLPFEYMELDDDIRDEVFEFMAKFQELTRFIDKMRLLCESSLTDKAKEIILSQIPIEYKTYYLAFGPEKIKSLGYRKDKLDNIMTDHILLRNGEIGKIILSNFSIGNRLSNVEIKDKLKNLYIINGIKISPKATDIMEVFKVKKIKLSIKDKRVDGLEILSIKL